MLIYVADCSEVLNDIRARIITTVGFLIQFTNLPRCSGVLYKRLTGIVITFHVRREIPKHSPTMPRGQLSRIELVVDRF